MKILRVAGIVLGVLLLGVLIVSFAASMKASAMLGEHYETHRIDIPVPYPLSEAERTAADGDDDNASATLAEARARKHGKHLVEARYGCTVCHGGNFGGGVMLDDPAIGTLLGPNLTSGEGGVVASYTIADWDRAVRHGVKPDGSPALMPSEDYFQMSDRELSDIVSYVRSLPPVNASIAKPSLGPIGKALVAFGKFPLSAAKLHDHRQAHAAEPPAEDDTAEFGAHLIATCTTCHRSNLAGGPMAFGPPGWPAAANLTLHASGMGSWTFEDFDKAMTDGVSKDGRALREPMSHVIPSSRAMTPTERKAIWTYLRTLPPLPMNP
jgi:mono/diheme cytochrome c family protein